MQFSSKKKKYIYIYIIKSLLLFSKDSYIPVSRKDSLTKLFIALNHNNIILRHPLYDTLKDLTNYLTVVLSSGQCTNSSSF